MPFCGGKSRHAPGRGWRSFQRRIARVRCVFPSSKHVRPASGGARAVSIDTAEIPNAHPVSLRYVAASCAVETKHFSIGGAHPPPVGGVASRASPVQRIGLPLDLAHQHVELVVVIAVNVVRQLMEEHVADVEQLAEALQVVRSQSEANPLTLVLVQPQHADLGDADLALGVHLAQLSHLPLVLLHHAQDAGVRCELLEDPLRPGHVWKACEGHQRAKAIDSRRRSGAILHKDARVGCALLLHPADSVRFGLRSAQRLHLRCGRAQQHERRVLRLL
mmetsp:Transcript_18150/g.68813  ORF Transcript_18150/g.68813 Transcript_18150/m.68813 type:complete len:276 (+) Transcript_18150:924-1751(+)